MNILGKDLLENKNSILSSSNMISSLLSGGFSVNVDLTGISNDDTNAIFKSDYDLDFFRLIS
jgi:hypothetical protein